VNEKKRNLVMAIITKGHVSKGFCNFTLVGNVGVEELGGAKVGDAVLEC